MNTFKAAARIAALSIIGAGLVLADPAMHSVTLSGVGNGTTQVVPTWGDVYVGPYVLKVDGKSQYALRVDFLDDYTIEEKWTAYETPLGAAASTQYTYNPTFSASIYDEEAYLFQQSLAAIKSSNTADQIAIQDAAWYITDPGSFGTTLSTLANSYVVQAEDNAVPNTDFSVLSAVDKGSGRPQEYIVASAPEPGSFLLLGAGLILAAFIKRRAGSSACSPAKSS